MTLLADAPGAFGFRAAGRRPLFGSGSQALLTGHRPVDRRQLAVVRYDDAGNPSPLPPWASHAQQELQRLVDLPAGWDGRRAKCITQAAVEAVVRALEASMVEHIPFPQYFPLPDGGLQAEWHAADHDVEIEVDAEGSVYVLAAGPASDAPTVDGQLDLHAVDNPVLEGLRSALHDLAVRVAAAR